MIAQLLNHQFVAKAAEMVADDLKHAADPDDRRSGKPHIADDVSAAEFAEARDALRTAMREQLEGQAPSEDAPAAEEGSEQPTKPREDFVFIPRSPEVSLLQSALEEYLVEQAADRVADEPPPDDRRSGAQEVTIAPSYLPDFPLEEDDDRRWFGAFETSKPKVFSDPRWVSALFAMGYRHFKKRHPFNETPAILPSELKPNARLVLVGDWATAIDRALKVRDRIAETLEDGRREGRDQHLVHLGDVYYSGWKREYEKRFLGPWPVSSADAGDIGSWTLNGNHDMYAGGHAYFQTCLGDPRFARQEKSSYFRMDTPDWRIIGLDTAWEDTHGGLRDPQAEWVREQARTAGGRRLMLLSHHQLFSAYSHGTKKLGEKIQPVIDDERAIRAWFWGHEHRCATYKPHRNLEYGRCVGHGGVPEYMPRTDADPVKDPATWEFRGRKPKLGQPWNTFGFAVLDFDGPAVNVSYVDEDGVCNKQEQLT